MEIKTGYFLSVINQESKNQEEIWFGPKVNPLLAPYDYENLSTNGVILFGSLDLTHIPLEQLRARFFNPRVKYMRIQIAGSESDFDILDKLGNVVVMQDYDSGTEFIGPRIDDKPSLYPIDGALLRLTHEAFHNIKQANWTFREASRQVRMQTRLASIIIDDEFIPIQLALC